MMPQNDQSSINIPGRSEPPGIVLTVILSLAALFLLAFILGFGVAFGERLHDGRITAAYLAKVAGTLAVCGLLFTWTLRKLTPAFALPKSPRMRRAKQSLIAAVIIALPLGILMGASTHPRDGNQVLQAILGSGPIPMVLAAALIAGWLAVQVPSLMWYRSVDEHERRAYDLGAIVAAHIYLIINPIWWMGWRGGFLSAPDGIIMFWTVVFSWIGVWLWQRSR